jgi:ribosomal protein S18 acetylase RimI-like enzyme
MIAGMRGAVGICHDRAVSTPTFRRADRADVPRIVQLVNRAFAVEAFFALGDRTSDEKVGEMLAHGTFFLAEVRDRLVGCVHAERREGGRGYIGMLAVDPALQRQGLGRQLMRVAERHCLQAHCTEAILTVINLRTELPPFYRSLGYQEIGTAPYGDEHRATRPLHFLVMRKKLYTRPGGD